MAHMDRLSDLPKELLLRILSLLPAKDVVVTMVLSKQWKFLWMLVPRLKYDHAMYQYDKRFSRFVYSSLLLHEAPVLESLRFKLDYKSSPINIGVWIRTAVKRSVRELDIKIHSSGIKNPVILPWSLYSGGCRMLVTLKLSNMVLVDASSLPASSFPSLKNLSLVYIKYPSEGFVNEFLSNCPVLEDLVVVQFPEDNVTVLTVKIPSLKSLSLHRPFNFNYIYEKDKACGFVIDAPLLESFDIIGQNDGGFCCIMNNMPKIVYANLDISYRDLWKILGYITSVKRLFLCLSTVENAYPVGSVFHRLVHLTLCTCEPKWLKVLMSLLRDSPKLQVLKFKHCDGFRGNLDKSRLCWTEPSSVPECVLASLETLEWDEYKGREEEKEVVAFIFRRASCLKKATISSRSTDPVKKLEMLRELSFLSRCSSFRISPDLEKLIIMDRISQLHDELLLGILSKLPTAKDVVATMVLSKRWRFLWMMVPRLVYDDSYQNLDYGSFSRLVDMSLFLHEAPVIDILHFRLGKTCGSGDIRVWIRAADKCSVRSLIIQFDGSFSASPAIPPRSLYTGCRTLAILRLTKTILVDVTSPISFPSLKSLFLLSVKYPGNEFVQRMLSNCPVLELLYVEQCADDNVTIFTIRVPSLKKLTLRKSNRTVIEDGCVIDAPSLESLIIFDDYVDGFCVIENEMPNIVDAYVDIAYTHPGNILSSIITKVKRLSLYVTPSKEAYPVGSIFCCLVFLKIFPSETEWLNLLMCVLRDSPNLRALKVDQIDTDPNQPRPSWSEPFSVPKCVISTLESLEWTEYEGAEDEKEVIAFILRNGSCLKKVTISSKSTDRDKKHDMLKELAFLSRRSPTCHLTFN